ncbi:galactose oxidase [Leptospira noguchii]|uniref:Kelch repeat-containing protein n=1 Tax=Leptospira noguchii TaxID=28182 RepID=UPI001F05118C|nr:kelch repeat-containing protein [Leptospira noguchii]MCH1910579.1 galactose oxidase [Leptospira noguchii]MCH1914917.1 galactose oxidase [Leptospira noguchii]UOG64815.1 galactose oxidase [Leptospira noguchii]
MQIKRALTIFLVSIGCLVFGTCGEQNSDESKTLLSILEVSSSNHPEMMNTRNMSVDPEPEPEPEPPWDGVGWGIKKDFTGYGRNGAVTFTINGKGYLAGGVSYYGFQNDLWEYDPTTDSWTQKVSIPVPLGYRHASGFALNGKGYYGLGIDNNSTLYKNWREYNPITNQWVSKLNFPGSARFGAVSFTIGSKGYLGTGATTDYSDGNNVKSDFWEYNPTTDSWRKVAGLPTTKRRTYATSFVIGTTGYVGGGSPDEVKNASLQDFWKYQPVEGKPGTWTQISSLPAQRTDMLGFSLWGVGIAGGGSEVQLWSYHPRTDSWQREVNLPYFPYDSLTFRSVFTIGDYAYGIVGQKVYQFYKVPPGQ